MDPMIDISNKVLQTERLVLRPFRMSDLDDFFSYASVGGVGEMAGWSPHGDREESGKILSSFIDGRRTFAIELGKRVVGSIGMERYPEKNYPELRDEKGVMLGFVLAKDCWGKGLMPEAVREVMRYLFEDEDLDFIIAGHFDWNLQSKRVLEKCGLSPHRTVTFVTAAGRTETAEDCIIWKKEWKALSSDADR